VHKPLEKTNWYLTYRPAALGVDMFTDDSEEHHTARRKVVGSVYNMSSILKMESFLDETTELFVTRIGEFADRGEAFDFGMWLEM